MLVGHLETTGRADSRHGQMGAILHTCMSVPTAHEKTGRRINRFSIVCLDCRQRLLLRVSGFGRRDFTHRRAPDSSKTLFAAVVQEPVSNASRLGRLRADRHDLAGSD